MKLTGLYDVLLLLGLSGVITAVPVVNTDESWDADHEANQTTFSMLAAAPIGTRLSRTGWTAKCDSQHTGNECSKAIDADVNTFWHTQYSDTSNPKPPHHLKIDMKATYVINGISSLPRQDGSNRGYIARHSIYASEDPDDFGDPVATGNWYLDKTQKFANFEPKSARYIHMIAHTEAHGNPWTSVADFNVYKAANPPAVKNGVGKWGPTLDFPVIPVAGAVEPTSGKILVWSAYRYDEFSNSPGGYTLTAEYDPATGYITPRRVDNTKHDMFCPGISIDGTGQIIVTGGDNAERTSIFDSATDTWISGPDMVLPRGYQASATCSDGRVFTIGGSWSGGRMEKDGEIYDPATKTWTFLPGALVKPMLTKDPQGIFRSDNHAWLFGWKNGTLFQAGPSTAMNWYYTSGQGDVTSAGDRKTSTGTDRDSMCGNAVMYDAVKGKILTVGGSTAYQDADATTYAHIITIGTPGKVPTVGLAGTGNMHSKRIFANSVVLPDGSVFISGGQEHGVPFEDSTPSLTPELYLPGTNEFIEQAPNSIVRVYHSMSILLPDATVFSGGGGLCGSCTTNHFDAQIFTPQYLLNDDGTAATRPTIKSVGAKTIDVGGTLTFTTGSAIKSASFIRYGSATHSLNTDQRRVPLTLKSAGTNSYSTVLPTDPGILIPGYWMLFVLNANGVPSVAATIMVTL